MRVYVFYSYAIPLRSDLEVLFFADSKTLVAPSCDCVSLFYIYELNF